MRPNASVRQPIIAGVDGHKLADLLRTWRCQPRQRSRRLFWSLLTVALVLDGLLVLAGARLLGSVELTPRAPPSERRMHVSHAGNPTLWEPLRHWVIRGEGRTQLFQSYCREAVRAVTGEERFEDNDPMAVIVSWMLRDSRVSADWEDYPFLRCDSRELQALVSRQEGGAPASAAAEANGAYVVPSMLRRSKHFRDLLRGVVAKGDAVNGVELTSLEKAAVVLKNRLALFDRIRSGGLLGAGVDSEAARAALREAYQSGSADLFAVAVSDFVEASRREHPQGDEPTVARRLACESWLNDGSPFRQALPLAVLAAGLLAVAVLEGTGRPVPHRILLGCGCLVGFAALAWTGAGVLCQTIVHEGTPLGDGMDAIRWAACATLAVGLLLTLLGRDGVAALTGAVLACSGLVLAECWPPAFAANWPALPKNSSLDSWLCVQLWLLILAYATLALAWGIALLILGRLAMGPANHEHLRGRVALCGGSLWLGVLLLTASAALDGLRAMQLGDAWRGWSVQALGTLIVLPGCVTLLFARRAGWLSPFSTALSVVLGIAFLTVVWHSAHLLDVWDGHPVLTVGGDAPVYGAGLVSLCLAAHACLRYHFGRHSVLEW
jgi:hypothetical protein